MSTIPAGVHVPTIDQRERVPVEAIDEFVERIALIFDPERIILFGSYAEDRPRPASDVDLLFVMDTDLRPTVQAVQILQSVEHRFGVDLIVITPKELIRRAGLGDSFLLEVLERGTVVYERPCR